MVQQQARRAQDSAERRRVARDATAEDLLCWLYETNGAEFTLNSSRLRTLVPGSAEYMRAKEATALDLARFAEVTLHDKARCVRAYIDRVADETLQMRVCAVCGVRDPESEYTRFKLADIPDHSWLQVPPDPLVRLNRTPTFTLLRRRGQLPPPVGATVSLRVAPGSTHQQARRVRLADRVVATTSGDSWERCVVVRIHRAHTDRVFTVRFTDQIQQDVSVAADWVPVSLPRDVAPPLTDVRQLEAEPDRLISATRRIGQQTYLYYKVDPPGGGPATTLWATKYSSAAPDAPAGVHGLVAAASAAGAAQPLSAFVDVEVHRSLFHNLYESRDGRTWHLVPEAVDDADESFDSCTCCTTAARKGWAAKRLPNVQRSDGFDDFDDLYAQNAPLRSVARGHDFGRLNALRLLGIDTSVSLCEQLVLAEARVYASTVKVVEDVKRSRLHGSSIVFLHEPVEVPNGPFGERLLKAALQSLCVAFVGPDGTKTPLEHLALKVDDMRLRPEALFNALTFRHQSITSSAARCWPTARPATRRRPRSTRSSRFSGSATR